MKKVLLFVSVAFFPFLLSAQSLSLAWEQGAIPPDGIIMLIGDPADFEIVSHLDVTNNSGSDLEVNVFRRHNSIVSGAENAICWGGICFGNEVDTALFPQMIGAGATLTDGFQGHYYPDGNVGLSSITYVFYDVNNIADSTRVTVEYKASPAAINELIEQVQVSNVYPNPANKNAFIEYTLPEGLFDATLIITNLVGSKVMEQDISSNESRIRISTEDLKNGIYFCTVKVNNQALATKKLVVNR